MLNLTNSLQYLVKYRGFHISTKSTSCKASSVISNRCNKLVLHPSRLRDDRQILCGRRHTGGLNAMDAFETARQNFLANVNEEEKALLESSVGPDDLLADIQGLNQDHEEQSILRRFMVKMGPSFRGLEQYSRAMDVLSTAKPEVLGLLWGGARIVLRVSRSRLGDV